MLILVPTHRDSIISDGHSYCMHQLVKWNGKQSVLSHKTELMAEAVKPRGYAENLAESLGNPDRKANK